MPATTTRTITMPRDCRAVTLQYTRALLFQLSFAMLTVRGSVELAPPRTHDWVTS